MFQKNDWVKITPTPDRKWSRWSNSPSTYDNFVGKIGWIEHIDEDQTDPNNNLYAVTVYFINGFNGEDAGNFYEWFKADHLIKTTEYDAKLNRHRDKVEKELQEWEVFKKKTTDEALKKIFAPEPPPQSSKQKKIDDPNQWELKTDPRYAEYDWHDYAYSPYDEDS